MFIYTDNKIIFLKIKTLTIYINKYFTMFFDDVSIDFDIFEDKHEDFSKLRKDYKKINKDPEKKELIERILKKDNILIMDDDDLIEEIKKKFTDKEIVKILYTWLSHRLKFITEKAQTFRKNILSTYSYLPPNKIMKKAMKYAKHLHFTPTEFDIFRKMFMIDYQTPLSASHEWKDDEFKNSGAMAKLLNYQPKEEERGKLVYDSSESGIVDNIIKSAIATEDLFYYCVSNSFGYKYADDLYDEIKVKKDYKLTDCVPPVIAAMFIQNIPYFEENMIQTNIGKFVQHSYEHKKLTAFENNLKLNLASDSSQYSDQTGKLISPLKDLQIRSSIQQSLWKLVLFLRNKQALNCDCTKFYNLISMYAPDLFVSQRYKNQTHQDSINIITRLFHVFSLYPLLYTRKMNNKTNDKNINRQIFYRPTPNSDYFVLKNISMADNPNLMISEFEKNRNASFIFIRPQKFTDEENNKFNEVSNIIDDKFDEKTLNNGQNNYLKKMKQGICGIPKSLLRIKYSKNEDNILNYTKATGVVVCLVLRNVNASNFKFTNVNDQYINEVNAIYKYSTFKNLITEYDTTKVLFSDTIEFTNSQNNSHTFKLQSVVLNSVYEDQNLKRNESSLKTKGSPFCIVQVEEKKSLIYHPYNFEMLKSDRDHYVNGPFNTFDAGFGSSIQKTDLTNIIEEYSEIFIYVEQK